jgi:hypothetical protein
MRALYLLGILTLLAFAGMAQERIDFHKPEITDGFDLKRKFKKHELVYTDVRKLYAQLKNADKQNVVMAFSDRLRWDFDLKESGLLAPGYTETVGGANGKKKSRVASARVFNGISRNGTGRISMTVDHGFFSAAITEGAQTWFIEQVQYLNGETDDNVLVVYNAEDVIAVEGAQCGMEETQQKVFELQGQGNNARTTANGCKLVELAIASDVSMLTKYGSTSAVFDRNIAVMNNVAVLYRHEFSDNIEFRIVTQYIATDESANPLLPLTGATDPSTVLYNFTSWAEAGNFNANYSIGQFWTNRDFSGSAVGIAWMRSVCTAGKYHALQDFGGNMAAMGVLTAHEIGHNFGANHDASGSATIMAPSVNSSSSWSDVSKSDVNYQLTIRTCLQGCSGDVTPDFVIFPAAACVGGAVNFKDKSFNNEGRGWEFESGFPLTSSMAQVSVSYAQAGIYNVNLNPVNGSTMQSLDRIVVSDVAINKEVCPIPSGAGGAGGIKSFILNEISLVSGSAAADGSKYMDRSCSQITELQTDRSYELALNIGQASAKEYVSLYIDYNGDGIFNESDEKVIATENAWSGYIIYDGGTKSWLRFTTPEQVTKNKVLRLRIITDTTKPGSACHDPAVGQVEDYGVVFREPVFNSLPVDLISFTGKSLKNYNLLHWRTVNETEMKSYTLHRSEDGIQFSAVATVESKNTGQSQFQYEYKDDRITNQAGGYYYKLEMGQLDGKSTFSRIVYIKNSNFQSGLALANCQTLITGDEISYDLISDKRRLVTISVFDVMGNRMKTWDRQIFEGKNHIKDDMSRLNAGIMFFSIKADDQPVIVQKLLK